jgi:hypothetical protein
VSRNAELPTLDSLAELADLIERRPGLYLRFSHGPDRDAGEPSVDYESGLELPGLSVVPLDPQHWWTRPIEDWVARQVCKYVDLADDSSRRRAWTLAGDEVARGPDHEPLVVRVRPVAWLADRVLEQAKQRYRKRFNVGQTSTGDAGSTRETT